MTGRYSPPSPFLQAIIANDALLSGGEFAHANLQHLIQMTCDEDRVNRDWAVFLLAQQEINTGIVRDALLQAAHDEDFDVRAEAIWGLAQLDSSLALPLVQRALRGKSVSIPILEAAAFCAHPSLVEDLHLWIQIAGDPSIDEAIKDALSACKMGTPPF